jgi:aminoglycoside phosphotransferase (APT) family kinase protein
MDCYWHNIIYYHAKIRKIVPTIKPFDKSKITLQLITDLIAEQFPQWAHLPITPVEVSGWDNKTFRLGKEMSIRLPSAEIYVSKVQKEQKWLPVLAPHLSLPIPTPLAMGQPSKIYPWNWSIYQWIEGKSANTMVIDDLNLNLIAMQLAQFLNELHTINATNGPLPGPHNFYRGDSPAVYDAETRSAIAQLQGFIDVDAVTSVWQKAISSTWSKNPVWIHGDLSAGNILIQDNQLAAVIDFGGMGIGDPACDLVIAWTFLTKESRKLFREHLSLDADTWARARGWALWKALITIAPLKDKTSSEALKQQHIIDEILNEHRFENFNS